MPYEIRRRERRFCVHKQGEDQPVPGGCHEAREQAVRHQRALYAAEASAQADTVHGMEAAMSTTSTATTGITFHTTGPASTSTITLTAADSPPEPGGPWEAILGVEGHPTGDRRYLIPGEIDQRELPLPLAVQLQNEDGHKGSYPAGRIDEIWRIPASEGRDLGYQLPDELPDDATLIMGRGVFDTGDSGQEAERLVEDQVLRGVSLDLPATRVALIDPETLEEIDPENLDLFDVMMGDHLTGIAGKIAGATIVSIPAFEEASIRVTDVSERMLVASAYGMIVRRSLTASAAGKAPVFPPIEWFETAEADEPTPLTVTADGRVFGHLALWGQCHAGFAFCETPPRSRTDYRYFHLGQIEADNGEMVDVGRVTVGKAGRANSGHAAVNLGRKGALEHYDSAGCVAAFVRAHDGVHGIWLAGAVRSDLPQERIRDLRANPPSGDWRWEDGGLELVAVLSVPVPGFPIPRAVARVASADSEERIEALVASGYTEDQPMSRADLRLHRLRTVSTEERKRLAERGAALPDGSYPIANCGDAAAAIRSVGRAAPAKQDEVRAHIRKRVRALGCTGSIFDNWR